MSNSAASDVDLARLTCASSGQCSRPAARGTAAECVALRKRAPRRLQKAASAKAIVRPAPDRDDPRDSDVAKALVRRGRGRQTNAIVRTAAL
jgi:hypothetical protein